MFIVMHDISYRLVKAKENNNIYTEYDVFKSDQRIGAICRYGAEIYYTVKDIDNNIIDVADTLRNALEILVYTSVYSGDKYIKTVGAWIEGDTIKVEYAKNNTVRHVKRVVQYNAAAGDLCITLDNAKYFYYEFHK